MRTTARHLLLLTLLWGLAVLPGLNAVGLVNWQESARAEVARGMQASGEWIVPTIAGKPYLAKPPMLYWCELALCKVLGRTAGEHELRYTVALAGLAGVLLTYLAARSLLRGAGAGSGAVPDDLARPAALWSAAFLATGVLYARSSRIGELDILLAPFTVAAVWGSAWAWLRGDAAMWRRLMAIGCSGLACAGAALTKGPPAIMTFALAIGGGLALASAWSARAPRPSRRFTGVVAGVCGMTAMGACLWLGREDLAEPRTWLGAILLAASAVVLAAFSPLLAAPRLMVDVARAWWSSGVVVCLAIGAGALWWWSRVVEARLGADVISRTLNQEASDNLRMLSPEASIQNFEAISYGAGLGSFACIAGVIWLITRPPRIAASWWIVLAWLGLGMLAFSVLGRGTGRYLTPLWPAVAMLGGIWFVRASRDFSFGRRMAGIAAAALVALAGAQSAWYMFKRPAVEGLRSPRDFMAELLRPEHGVDPARMAAMDFWVGSLDFYAKHHVEPLIAQGPWIDFPHEETPLAEFLTRVRGGGEPFTLLIRGSVAPDDPDRSPTDHTLPVEYLRRQGLVVEEIALSARFLIDRQRTEVKAVRVRAAASSE